jgi:hypothetical protein
MLQDISRAGHQWLTPVILSYLSPPDLSLPSSCLTSPKITRAKWTVGVAQAEHLLYKCEAPSSKPQSHQKKDFWCMGHVSLFSS